MIITLPDVPHRVLDYVATASGAFALQEALYQWDAAPNTYNTAYTYVLGAPLRGIDWTFAWTPDNTRNAKIAAALRLNTELAKVLYKHSNKDGVEMLVYRIKYPTDGFMP